MTANRTRCRRAFSLVELLFVIAIVLILMVLVTLATRGISSGHNVTSAAQILAGQFEIARQTASALNRPIEVRLLKYASSDGAGNARFFRALHLFRVNDDSTLTPLGKIQLLPQGVVVLPETVSIGGSPASTLTDDAKPGIVITAADAHRVADAKNGDYEYVPIRFRSDGSINLADDQHWYLSVGTENDADKSEVSNYAVIQVTPSHGIVRVHRPG